MTVLPASWTSLIVPSVAIVPVTPWIGGGVCAVTRIEVPSASPPIEVSASALVTNVADTLCITTSFQCAARRNTAVFGDVYEVPGPERRQSARHRPLAWRLEAWRVEARGQE